MNQYWNWKLGGLALGLTFFLALFLVKPIGVSTQFSVGAGVATVLIFISNALGLLNVEHFSIKSLNIGVIIGGGIFGLGWALSGYCPGTVVSGLGAFKKDALFYLLGGVVGAFLFTQTYSYFESLGWFEKLTASAEALITLTPELTGILPIGSIGGIIFGGILMLLAILIPAKLNN